MKSAALVILSEACKMSFQINVSFLFFLKTVKTHFLYPLKTLENLWFTELFRSYKNGGILVFLGRMKAEYWPEMV